MASSGNTARGRDMVLACSLLLGACATTGHMQRPPVGPGTRYVAMGSSFAAGPGVPTPVDEPRNRCARSTGNYAHLLARDAGLTLVDVSCSGATTAHILGPWNELPAQIDAVTGDTGLVTITIGGNDIAYIGSLGAASCRMFPAPPAGAPGGKCPNAPTVSERDWTALEGAMTRIVTEVRRRAPAARIVLVDYLSVLPAGGTCAATPLPPGQADASRATARRLAGLTAQVAASTGAEVLKVSDMSRDHSACSTEPWSTGFPVSRGPGFIPYHPNARGMAAVAHALARHLAMR